MMMGSPQVLLCSLLLVLPGCMTERVQPITDYPSVPRQSTFLVNKIEYDERGRPLFRHTLGKRPGAAGERFTIVHAVNDKPSRSYDIAIVEQRKADMSRPLAVVYEWTGRGFEGGLAISQGIFPNGYSASSTDGALAFLAIKTAPIVIGGVAGFVVGIFSSLPETALELKRVIVNARETVLGYAVYHYDEKDRIRFMKLYPPAENAAELVKTEFFYESESKDPYKTVVTSILEKKIRMIH